MLRVIFLQDAILTDRYKAYRTGNEEDVDFDLALELYRTGVVDILNPFDNDDLYENIDKYEKSWKKFEKWYKKGENVNDKQHGNRRFRDS